VSTETTIPQATSTGVAEDEHIESQDETQETSVTVTPIEFYAEITQREDIRVILDALARN
jgi:hypothetical protein